MIDMNEFKEEDSNANNNKPKAHELGDEEMLGASTTLKGIV